MKKPIAIIVIILSILLITGLMFKLFSQETSIEQNQLPKEVLVLENVNYEYDEPTTLDESYDILSLVGARKNMAVDIYENLLLLEYSEDHPAVKMIKKDIDKLENDYLYYQEIYNNFWQEKRWEDRAEEYPIATQVWLYMKNTLGWSDYVCAGVMGNMMAECGGQTLKLNPNAKNKSSGCYGICQWHPKYFPAMQNASLEKQLEFLGVSIEKTFNGWAGKTYNCNYNEFLTLTDCEEVAEMFCMVYERPGEYNSQRSRNALKAYEYYVD